MKKATKVFICLLLVVLLIFFTFRIFGDELAEPLYNHGLISDSAYCKSRGGKIYVSSSYADATRICKLEHSDVGKKCSDNNDCKGYCLINNRVYLKEKILELRKEDSKYFYNVNVDKFKREAKIETEIEGHCGSRFKYLSGEPEIVIRDDMISLGGRWGVTGYWK